MNYSTRIASWPLLLLFGFVGIVAPASLACAQSPKGTTGAAPAPTPPRTTTAEPLGVQEKAADFEFSYHYPALAAAWPGFVAWLDNDRKASQSDLAKQARNERIRALQEGSQPFLPFQIDSEWKVITDLPGWLSLSETTFSYKGGAHPWHDSGSILWDKRAQQTRHPMSLFISEVALDQAVQLALCNALDRQRGRGGQGSIVRDPSDPSTMCPPAKDATILLGSSSRQAFDRIGFLFSSYLVSSDRTAREVTLPVTSAVIAAVRPEFRSAFALAH